MSRTRDSVIKLTRRGYPDVTGIWNNDLISTHNEKRLAISVRDVNAGNIFVITGRTGADLVFKTIGTVTGVVEDQIIDVTIFDYIQINLTVRDPANSSAVFVMGSSISDSGGTGQSSSAASTPVVLSSEQETILNAIKIATEAINIDADSLAKETGGNLDIISGDTTEITDKLPTIGSQASTASLSVTLSSNEPDIGTTVTSGSISVDALPANATVNLSQVAGTATSVDGGLSDIGTQRVILATDSPGGATEYTEGDTATTISGLAMMFESNTTTSQVDVVSNATPLPISDADGSITVDGAVSVSNLLANNHDVTVSNASIAVTGPLTNAELRFSDVGVAVAGLLGDGHNVKVDNDATDGIPIINQTGDTLSVGGAVTVTSGAVTVSQGTRTSLNANATIQVQGTDVTLTSGLPIKNETGANLGIDVVNVSGSAINDGNAIHVSQGTAANLKATVIAAGDIANNSADSGNPVKTGAKAIDFNNSGHAADVTAADRVNSIALQNGQQLVADLAHRKAITLGGLDDTYDTTNESHNSGDIDVTGFRYASFMFTIESNSNPTDFQWTLEEKSSGGNYFQVTSGFWAFFKYEDAGTATAISVSVMFPLGGADTIRIVGTVSSDASLSKYFTITNSEIGLRN